MIEDVLQSNPLISNSSGRLKKLLISEVAYIRNVCFACESQNNWKIHIRKVHVPRKTVPVSFLLIAFTLLDAVAIIACEIKLQVQSRGVTTPQFSKFYDKLLAELVKNMVKFEKLLLCGEKQPWDYENGCLYAEVAYIRVAYKRTATLHKR